MTFPAEKFIRRFLQHVLPKGFIKVRYYGFMSPTKRTLLEKAKILLGATSVSDKHSEKNDQQDQQSSVDKALRCPVCGAPLIILFSIPRKERAPPCLDPPSIIVASLVGSTI